MSKIQTTQLADFTIKLLCKSTAEEPLVFQSDYLELLERAFDLLFSNVPASTQSLELEGLMQLSRALETKRGCPKAAHQIVDAIANDARACALLSIASNSPNRGVDFARLFAKTPNASAPKHDAPVPKGAFKASSFLTPGQEVRRRRP